MVHNVSLLARCTAGGGGGGSAPGRERGQGLGVVQPGTDSRPDDRRVVLCQPGRVA